MFFVGGVTIFLEHPPICTYKTVCTSKIGVQSQGKGFLDELFACPTTLPNVDPYASPMGTMGQQTIPKCSMRGIFDYIYHQFMPNVGKHIP